MTGGLLRLIIYGKQDLYLTNNPQINFFKTVYKKHVNFVADHHINAHDGTSIWSLQNYTNINDIVC